MSSQGSPAEADYFPEAAKLSYKLKIDFGSDVGIKKSCAQLTHYPLKKLLWKQVVCVVNLPPKQVANEVSEVLVLGVSTAFKGRVLLVPDVDAFLGSKIF